MIKNIKKALIVISSILALSLIYTVPQILKIGSEYKILKESNLELVEENKILKEKYQISIEEITNQKIELIRSKRDFAKHLKASADRLEKEIKETKRTKIVLNNFSDFLDKNNDRLKGQNELLEKLLK